MTDLSNLIEREIPFEINFSWGSKEPTDSYDFMVQLKYNPNNGEIKEFTQDLCTGDLYNEDDELVNNLVSFFRNHLGIEAEYRYEKMGDLGSPGYVKVYQSDLNLALQNYYSTENPKNKKLQVKERKVSIAWDGYFHR